MTLVSAPAGVVSGSGAGEAGVIPLNLIDVSFAMAMSLSKFYPKGWGDRALLGALVERFEAFEAPAPIRVRWLTLPEAGQGVTRATGYFETPVRDFPIPAASRAAYFELILPEGSGPRVRPPVCVYLAATADQGFGQRRRHVLPLVRRGLGALILENPYYGLRKPADQRFSSLGSVADQLLMNLATIEEARALLAWLREDGFEHLGVSGYSMGGFMSAYVAALMDEPTVCVPCAAGVSPASAFTHSTLRRLLRWDILERELGDDYSARDTLEALYESFSLARLPQPRDLDLAILVGASRDGIIAPHDVTALARLWQGVEVRWMRGGHISALAIDPQVIGNALLDAFGTSMAKYG